MIEYLIFKLLNDFHKFLILLLLNWLVLLVEVQALTPLSNLFLKCESSILELVLEPLTVMVRLQLQAHRIVHLLVLLFNQLVELLRCVRDPVILYFFVH